MRKLFLTAAAFTFATASFVMLGSSGASAGAFCATYPDGGGNRSCGYATYNQCARAIRGAGGQCEANPNFGGYEDDSYAYVPGPIYVPGPAYGYGYNDGPRYYRRPGFGVYFGAY